MTIRSSTLNARYVCQGSFNGFSPHEALEVMLLHVLPSNQFDANALAHKLIRRFGSLYNVLNADPKMLMAAEGIDINTALFLNQLSAINTFARLDNASRDIGFSNSEDCGRFALELFSGCTHESFYVICMDLAHRIISYDKICDGTFSQAELYLRNVVELVLLHEAESVAFAHNHPHGVGIASENDLQTTKLLCAALFELGIMVVDHIIVYSETDYLSMRDVGQLPKQTKAGSAHNTML